VTRPILQHLGINHLLAAAALVFGLIAVWPWLAPIPALAPAGQPPPSPDPAIPPLLPPKAYSAIAERPLFSPTRRPAPNAPVVSDSGVARYRLLGLVTAGGARHALIADGSRRLEIGEGSVLDTWTVLRIEPDRVVLTSPEGEASLRMERPAAAPSPNGR
jgi:hypothetical protein